MNNENEILEFLNKNGLRYLSKFETTESQFKSFLKKKIDVFEPNLSTYKKNELIYLITEKMLKLFLLNLILIDLSRWTNLKKIPYRHHSPS